MIARRLNSLGEVEQIVADAVGRNERGRAEDNRTIKQLAFQGPRLLERGEAAQRFYEELKRTYKRERALRLHQ